MNKDSIAKLRKIVQNPIRFIDTLLDSSVLFFEKHIRYGYIFSLLIICGSMLSIIIPQSITAEKHSPQPEPGLTHGAFGYFSSPKAHNKESGSLSSAVLIKNSANYDNQSKDLAHYKQLHPSLAERIRRFPLMVILSVRPGSHEPRAQLSFALKTVHELYCVPIFSDEVLDQENQQLLTYGAYINGLSATRAIWEPMMSSESRTGFTNAFNRSFAQVRDYFFSVPEDSTANDSETAEVMDVAAETIELMQNDVLQNTAQNHPSGGNSTLFDATEPISPNVNTSNLNTSIQDREDGLETPNVFASLGAFPLNSNQVPATNYSPPNIYHIASSNGSSRRSSVVRQRRITRLLTGIRDSVCFKVDFLKTFAIRIEQ